MSYLFCIASILFSGFLVGMFLVFSAASLSNPKGTKFAERMLKLELVLLVALYAGSIALCAWDHGVAGALLPWASVPLIFGTFELKRREAVGR
jgi:cytochrome bd-type quinol oxidase subunit 1